MNLKELRDSNGGKFPAYAWPGGYPIVYVMTDGETLCAACANGENGSLARIENGPDDSPRDGWCIEEWDVFYEGANEFCAHCNVEIESAYGDPDANEEQSK